MLELPAKPAKRFLEASVLPVPPKDNLCVSAVTSEVLAFEKLLAICSASEGAESLISHIEKALESSLFMHHTAQMSAFFVPPGRQHVTSMIKTRLQLIRSFTLFHLASAECILLFAPRKSLDAGCHFFLSQYWLMSVILAPDDDDDDDACNNSDKAGTFYESTFGRSCRGTKGFWIQSSREEREGERKHQSSTPEKSLTIRCCFSPIASHIIKAFVSKRGARHNLFYFWTFESKSRLWEVVSACKLQ